MKKLLISFFIFLFAVPAYGTNFQKIVLRVQYSDSSCPKTAPDSSVAPAAIGVTDCLSGTATLQAFSNCVAVYSVTCDVLVYDDVAYSFQTVTGVTFGQEATAAQSAFESFVSSVQSKTCGDGYIADGYLAGYVYETMTDVTAGSITVDVSMWKRTVCSTLGNGELTPIGSLSGGSAGGTSIDYAQMKTAMQDALDASTALADIATGISDISSTGGGITQDQTRAAVADGVGDALGASPGGLGLIPGTSPSAPVVYQKKSAYLISEIDSLVSLDFTSRFTQFITDMKATPLFSTVSSLSGLANTPAGGSVLQVSFGNFGNVNFDLANYAGTYNYVKGFLLLLASYLMIRIIVLKR